MQLRRSREFYQQLRSVRSKLSLKRLAMSELPLNQLTEKAASMVTSSTRSNRPECVPSTHSVSLTESWKLGQRCRVAITSGHVIGENYYQNEFSVKILTLSVFILLFWYRKALWMLPTDEVYGTWPSSGEIDMVEIRGNDHIFCDGFVSDIRRANSNLHWGVDKNKDKYAKTRWSK